MNVWQLVKRFFSTMWNGIDSINVPVINISLASFLLGLFALCILFKLLDNILGGDENGK